MKLLKVTVLLSLLGACACIEAPPAATPGVDLGVRLDSGPGESDMATDAENSPDTSVPTDIGVIDASIPDVNPPNPRSGESLVFLFNFDNEEPEVAPAGFEIEAFAVDFQDGVADFASPTAYMLQISEDPWIDPIVESGAFSVEGWISLSNEPDKPDQLGRVVSSSTSTIARNFTIGVEASNELKSRLRLTDSQPNGGSEMSGGLRTPGEWIHFALVYERSVQRLFMNGVVTDSDMQQNANLASWDPGYPLIFGNEDTNNRPFYGKIDVISIWSRALSSDEIVALAASR